MLLSQMKVIDVDFTRNLEQYYSKLYSNPNNITNLQDMVRHAKTDAREMYPDRDILSWEAALSYNFTEDSLEYKRALSKIRWIGRDGTVTGVLDKYDLDAIILPTDISYRLAAPGGMESPVPYGLSDSLPHAFPMYLTEIMAYFLSYITLGKVQASQS